jgi:hypothetical protein
MISSLWLLFGEDEFEDYETRLGFRLGCRETTAKQWGRGTAVFLAGVGFGLVQGCVCLKVTSVVPFRTCVPDCSEKIMNRMRTRCLLLFNKNY